MVYILYWRGRNIWYVAPRLQFDGSFFFERTHHLVLKECVAATRAFKELPCADIWAKVRTVVVLGPCGQERNQDAAPPTAATTMRTHELLSICLASQEDKDATQEFGTGQKCRRFIEARVHPRYGPTIHDIP